MKFMGNPISESDMERFESLREIDKSTGCWEWTGCKTNTGYGQFSHCCKTILAHRFSFSAHFFDVGVFQSYSNVVMHKCDNRSCVNPMHLSLGSQHDNVIDAVRKGRNRYLSCDDHARKKIDSSVVISIIRDYVCGSKIINIMSKYGVTRTIINEIIAGRAWRPVTSSDEVFDILKSNRGTRSLRIIKNINKRKNTCQKEK